MSTNFGIQYAGASVLRETKGKHNVGWYYPYLLEDGPLCHPRPAVCMVQLTNMLATSWQGLPMRWRPGIETVGE